MFNDSDYDSSEEEEEIAVPQGLDNKLLEWHLQLTEQRCKYVKAILYTFDYALAVEGDSSCKMILFYVSKASIHKDHIERVHAQYFKCKTTYIVEHAPNVEDPSFGVGVLLHNLNEGFECHMEHIRNKDASTADLTPYPNWRRGGGGIGVIIIVTGPLSFHYAMQNESECTGIYVKYSNAGILPVERDFDIERSTQKYDAKLMNNILVLGQTGGGKTVYVEKLIENGFIYGDDLVWISADKLVSSVRFDYQKRFARMDTFAFYQVSATSDLDLLLNGLVPELTERHRETNRNTLIVFDDLISIADQSRVYSRFLETCRHLQCHHDQHVPNVPQFSLLGRYQSELSNAGPL